MSLDALRGHLGSGENVSVAFVRNATSTALIGRTVCALLNSEGGQVYCGVDEGGELVGIAGDVRKQAGRLERQLKDLLSPASLFAVEAVDLDGKALIVVEVPQGRDRPYVFDGGVFLRRGPSTSAADAETLKALVRAQAETPLRWERRPSSMSVEDLDTDEVRTTVRKVESNGRFAFSDRADDLAVVRDFSGYANGVFTHAGDVLFSRKPSQRHPQCRVQFVQFEGDKADDRYKDNRLFEGPVVRAYFELVSAIRAATPVRSMFLAGTVRRVDQSVYDILAVREGLVNAFVHRDYSAHSGGLRVLMFATRLEIWNSGCLPEGLSPGDLRREHASILVNPDIANVFYALDQMERIGRGTEKIVKASKALGARPPLWRDEPSGVTLTIFASASTEGGGPVELNDRQNRLLLDLQPGDSFTPKEYQDRYASEVTPRQARRDLEELETLSWLVREGATRSTRYRLP